MLLGSGCGRDRAGPAPSASPLEARRSAARSASRPDIVLVVVDALRRDHLPLYGYARDTAPFLTRLAREGVVFERAHAASTWTAPATASLLTSLYPTQHGVTSGLIATRRLQRLGAKVRVNRLPDPVETLPEALARAGYSTFAVTENVNIGRQIGFDQGFGRFRHLRRETTAAELNAKLFKWRGRLRAARPYFLYLHYLDPHAPYRENAAWFDEQARGTARVVSAYDSEVRFFDTEFARAYERLGWARDTLLVFTADHGEGFDDHGFGGHGHTLYGELLDVPLLVVFPDRRGAGRRVRARASHLDVLPTLAEFAGLPRNPAHQGRSLLPAVEAPSGATDGGQPRTLFAHLRRETPERVLELHAVIHGDLKLIAGSRRAPLLFDLARDPGERANLAPRRPDVVRDLERRWVEFERRAPRHAADQREVDLDAETQERLHALGYVR